MGELKKGNPPPPFPCPPFQKNLKIPESLTTNPPFKKKNNQTFKANRKKLVIFGKTEKGGVAKKEPNLPNPRKKKKREKNPPQTRPSPVQGKKILKSRKTQRFKETKVLKWGGRPLPPPEPPEKQAPPQITPKPIGPFEKNLNNRKFLVRKPDQGKKPKPKKTVTRKNLRPGVFSPRSFPPTKNLKNFKITNKRPIFFVLTNEKKKKVFFFAFEAKAKKIKFWASGVGKI